MGNLKVAYLPQEEQLWEEQVPQDELAVLLNFPPLEKAKADIIRSTFLLLHWGKVLFRKSERPVFRIRDRNDCSEIQRWASHGSFLPIVNDNIFLI